jgi:peptidylprolyl isomerase
MRTDTERFRQLVEARRNRRDDWYLVPADYIDLCNVPLVGRPRL